MKNGKVEDADEAKANKSGADFKLSAYFHHNNASPHSSREKHNAKSPPKEMLLDDTYVLFLPGNWPFDWDIAQRKANSSKIETDVSKLHRFFFRYYVSKKQALV